MTSLATKKHSTVFCAILINPGSLPTSVINAAKLMRYQTIKDLLKKVDRKSPTDGS